MKKLFCLLSFFLSVSCSLYSQTFPDRTKSEKEIVKSEKLQYERLNKILDVQYPGDSTIDITYYKLDLSLTNQPKYLKGVVTVSAKSTVPALDKLFLDLQNTMKVDSVKIGSLKLNFSQPTASAKLVITLNTIYNAGQQFSINIYYQGTPGSSGFGSFTFGDDGSGGPAIYTLSEPYGASDWWPCKDTPADKADSSDVWITVDDSLTAVSNGVLQQIINNGNGTHTFRWKNSYPIAQYLISMAIANYSVYNTYFKYSPTDSMLISNYIWRKDFNDATKNVLNKTANMIGIYSKVYGPYPFLKEKYGHAQFGWSGGMEHQTITSVGAYYETLIAHELAHQWFGDKITCKTWNDIWLNEGFATYSESIYYENEYGKQAYDSYITSLMKTAEVDKRRSVYVDDISSVGRIFNYSTSYAKGGVVLHMLRGIVGDSTFFKILRTYNNDPRFAYGVASTSDFESVAENVSGLDLRYFFNEWIYGVGYPSYKFKWNYTHIGGGMYQISFDVEQASRLNPDFFIMPIQLKVSTDAGDTLLTVFNNQKNQSFTFVVKGRPVDLVFDPNNFIMKEAVQTEIPKEIIPTEYTLDQNYPNPFNPFTVIRYHLPKRTFVKLVITDAAGKEATTLVNEDQLLGSYSVRFDGSKYASGVYFYTLTTDDFHQTRKMVLVK